MERNMSMIKFEMEFYVKNYSNGLFDTFVSDYDLEDEDLISLREVFNSVLLKNLVVVEVKETPVIGFKRNN
jgi:hypothetical protein